MKYLSILTYKTTIISILLFLLVVKIGFNEDWTLLTQSVFVLTACGIFHLIFKKFTPVVYNGFNRLLRGSLQKSLKKLRLEKLSHLGEFGAFSDIRNSFIIGLIILLIISSFQTGALGILSLILFVLVTFKIRSIVRWNGSPIFNPVAITSLVLIFINQIYDTELFIGWTGVNYSIEAFGETIQFGTYISMLGALLSVYFSKKYPYTLAFFATFSLLGYSFLGVEDLNYLLLDGTLYFFFGIMILEPKTSVSGKYQWAYGILLAILLTGILKFHITGDYILAICLINLVYFIGKNWIHKQDFGGVTHPIGQKWLCEPCGYIYDPVQGDIDSGIAPGTEFTDIPDTWFCPVCGVTKADFIPLDTSKRHQAVVIEKILLNPVTLKLVIETSESLTSIAGQFISFYWKDSEGEFSRSYSIAEHTGNSYTFLIKLTEKGRGAKKLTLLTVGEKIEIHGVSGKFILKDSNNPKIFIATGTGLAPIYNMIRSLPEDTMKTLYFTVTSQEELFYIEELSHIKNLDYQIHLTKEKIDGYNFGRVDINFIEAKKNTEWYLCGSPKMVEEATMKLKKRGFEVVLSEEFN